MHPISWTSWRWQLCSCKCAESRIAASCSRSHDIVTPEALACWVAAVVVNLLFNKNMCGGLKRIHLEGPHPTGVYTRVEEGVYSISG